MTESSKCHHGSPSFDNKDEYKEGLRSLLKIVGKYTERRSKSVGPKSAELFMTAYPNLVTHEMIRLLVGTGTTMLLTKDPRAKFVVQSIGEVIGSLEKKLNGHSTIKDELKFEKDADGFKQAKESQLVRFFRKRIPCACLEKNNADVMNKEVKMARCSFAECAELKPLKHLALCAGCMKACYCCPDCQRNDWSSHSKLCLSVTGLSKPATTISSKKVSSKASTSTATTDRTECETEFETESDDSSNWQIKEVPKNRSCKAVPRKSDFV